jgi:pre-rRNA-processing protein IPI3
VGCGGVRSRVFTVSKDQTCKVHSLASGDLLLDVTFSVGLTSIAVDVAERSVFVGSNSGPIYTFALSSPPRDLKLSLTGDKKTNMFTGHTQEVTSLSVSTDGFTLASGSKVRVIIICHY